MEYLPEPSLLGLPKKYTAWRENQSDAILKAVFNDKRVMISICPTGFGKSLMYVTAGIMLGGRTVILTSTKGLQSQLLNDFSDIGMVQVSGKNAYRCVESKNRMSCDQGMCNLGMFCPLRKGGCAYYDAVRTAQKAPIVITNYSFWLYSNAFGEGIGTPNLLVCDEGHDAPEEVSAFLEVKLDRADEIIMRLLPVSPEKVPMKDWKLWAIIQSKNVAEDIENLTEDIREDGPSEYSLRRLAKLRTLAKHFEVLAAMDIKNWVCNITPFEIQFAPIRVSDKCQEILFRDIPKILLTSGSINYKTGEMLGIKDEECTVDEYPHTFPVDSRIVYLVKGARLNAKSDGESIQDWLWTADSIIRDRLDRKGIFHTTSYGRRDFVRAHSQYKQYMMSHHKRDVVQMVGEFKAAFPPKILVSPSVTTGWDFPYSECEYQILGKVPYPDSRNVITAARNDADPEYGAYIAMQQIVQACGRGTRAEDDHCENFIIDDNFGGWFLKRYGKFAPQWFRDSLTRRLFAPEPPRRIGG